MEYTLVVVKPFADYQRGDSITDPEVITAILAGDHEHENSVVRVAAEKE